MFGVTNIAKNSDKSKYVYSCNGIAFNGLGSWSFGNDFARNFIIFGIDNSSTSHTNNRKKIFLVLVEGFTDDIYGSIGAAEKNFSINLSKAKSKFCFSLHNNGYLFVKGNKSISLKQIIKMSNFHLSFA